MCGQLLLDQIDDTCLQSSLASAHAFKLFDKIIFVLKIILALAYKIIVLENGH